MKSILRVVGHFRVYSKLTSSLHPAKLSACSSSSSIIQPSLNAIIPTVRHERQQLKVVPTASLLRQFSTDVTKCNDDVTSDGEPRTANERLILDVLRAKFPEAEHLDVKEGGQSCGDVFEVFVITKEFKGLSKVKQHQMVIQHIRSIVKDAHVIRVSSQVPT